MELAGHVDDLAEAIAKGQVVRVRHPHLERRVDTDEPDSACGSQSFCDLLRRPVAAPFDRADVAYLARIGHVVRESGEERRLAVARQDEVAMMEIEVIGQPEDVRLVVSVDAGIPEEEERIETVLVHQSVGESAAPLHLRIGEVVPHQRNCSRSQSATSGRYL